MMGSCPPLAGGMRAVTDVGPVVATTTRTNRASVRRKRIILMLAGSLAKGARVMENSLHGMLWLARWEM